MTKILSIIIIIIIFAGGGWYYKNKMMTPSEGTPVGYESGRKGDKDRDEKFNKKFIKITFPNASSTLVVGEKVKTTWDSRTNFNLKLTYPVTLVDVNDKTKKPVELGTAKNSLFNKVFNWTVPVDTVPGSYKIVFGGKQGGESEVFKVSSDNKEGYKLITSALRATSTIIFVEYNVIVDTTKVDPANVNIRITCPIKNVSVRTPDDSVDKCQKIVPNLGVVENQSGPNTKTYIFQFAFTNSNSVAEMITAEAIVNNNLFDNGKVGVVVASVVSMIDPTTTASRKVIMPTVDKLSSDINTIDPRYPYDHNNLAGIKVDIALNFKSNDGDIYAQGTTAVVGLKDVQTSKIIATTSVNVTPSESGLKIFPEGAKKVVFISAIFATSTLPFKNITLSSFVQSITFSPVIKDPSLNRVILDKGLETLNSDNFITISR
jgi:hypothetical protein